MAVRLASDTIRTLYAIKCITKDVKHRSHSPVSKNRTQEMCKVKKGRHFATKPPNDSVPYHQSPAETLKQKQKQEMNLSAENALVHKVHPSDRPQPNNVPERANCKELDDIFAKWNVHEPKK